MFFGERFGVISPRASYIRSVCGCISASSAATEIMKTPRCSSMRASVLTREARLGLVSRSLISRSLSSLARTRTARGPAAGLVQQLAPGVLAVERLGQLLDGLPLLVAELARDLELHPVVDVAAAASRSCRGGPSPRSRWVLPCWVPGGILIRFEPFSVGTSIVAPWIASATVTGRSTSRLPSGRWRKTGEGATRVVT